MYPASTAAQPQPMRVQFQDRFGVAPLMVFAPGRVNLIGDHIDYCGGHVLPMPIEQGTLVAVAARHDGCIHADSLNLADAIAFGADERPHFPAGHWGRFVVGALAVLNEPSRAPAGMNVMVAGNLPASGLSSSASLSLALLAAIALLGGRTIDGLELALLAQRVEHEHVGVHCGLMDQAAIALGVPGAALLFDCAAQTGRPVPLAGDLCQILIADSGVSRTLATSAYNERRATLALIARRLGVAESQLARSLNADHRFDDPLLDARARHVRTEQRRVLDAVAALDAGDAAGFGQLLRHSHRSLRDDFEVSSPELDALAAAFNAQPGCYGARMTGAGFGGAVVAAVRPEAAAGCSAAVRHAYRQATGRDAGIVTARASGGVRQVG